MPSVTTSYTFKLVPEEQERLKTILSTGNYVPAEVPYTVIAVKAVSWKCAVNLYTSGKCLIQGRGAGDFVENVMEPEVLRRVVSGDAPSDTSEDDLEPHIGVDESGKGDFLGPLVIAAAYTDKNTAKRLKNAGVRDSKEISSDKRALEIAAEIRKILGPLRYSIVMIGNDTYNRLYAKMRGMNTILSWGHARCIENVLNKVPSCTKAISDQFGNKESVRRAMMEKGKSIELIQRHHAESDIAVAAASILAREGFLLGIKKLGEKYGVIFPKGAGDAVIEAGDALVEAHGPAVLISTAKCHFKTLDRILEDCGFSRNDMPEEGRIVSKVYADRVSRSAHRIIRPYNPSALTSDGGSISR